MSSLEKTLSRMKSLYTYGQEINENNTNSVTLANHKLAADGNYYGIVRECNKYYIKSAPKGKETLAENYEYIGGFCNKSRNEYKSYANALRHLDMKISSINEACEAKVNISSLEPFMKNNALMTESSSAMQKEIARQRQIMHNVAMIMNESSEIGASNVGNTVMYNGKNPETPKTNDTKSDDKTVNADPEYKGSNTNGVEKKVTPFDEQPKNTLKECDCADGKCTCGKEDWGSEGIGKGEDPKNIGWDIEGQTRVDEEEDWGSEGLPSTAGVGEADTDHNNTPFNNTINEEDEDDDLADMESNVDDMGEFNSDNDNDFEIDTMSDDNDELEFEIEPDEVDETDPESISNEIDRLQSLLDDLNSDEENNDFEDENNFDSTDYEISIDDDFDSEDEDNQTDSLMESKNRKMNTIVENVINKILKEDELHVFGKHPGYQKKPMDLMRTGEDSNEWGRDWNDDSVHSEQPFGTQIGSSFPFTDLVNEITSNVMKTLSNNKKKMR